MAVDIKNVKADDTVIKHGIQVINLQGSGHQTLETNVVSLPTIETISGKYQGRFDDPTYY